MCISGLIQSPLVLSSYISTSNIFRAMYHKDTNEIENVMECFLTNLLAKSGKIKCTVLFCSRGTVGVVVGVLGTVGIYLMFQDEVVYMALVNSLF